MSWCLLQINRTFSEIILNQKKESSRSIIVLFFIWDDYNIFYDVAIIKKKQIQLKHTNMFMLNVHKMFCILIHLSLYYIILYNNI